MVALLALSACGTDPGGSDDGGSQPGSDGYQDPGKGDSYSDWQQPEPLNPVAADLVIYELQARSANACRLGTGSCDQLPVPDLDYHGPGCSILDELAGIRKSTLDDLLRTSASPDRTTGITLQYIDDVVGANTVWLMPIFPHNDRYDLPDACDDLGSPYAVRDYLHVRGSLSEGCIADDLDEWSADPCWGDAALARVIEAAHARGLRVMLDLAFNHLGHEYHYYDMAGVVPLRDYLSRGAELRDFEATYDPGLVWPEVLDTDDELPGEAESVLNDLCGQVSLAETEGVRRYLMWREGFDWEREAMSCQRPATLENQLPGFYLGRDGGNPSQEVGDNFTNQWVDVKFLFHNEANEAHQWEFFRSREYAFRVVNYYLAMGVDGFRLDHANGLTENEWRYVFRKAEYYQALRGLPEPIFLSESFFNILDLNRVFDVLTEGYHHDITHGRRHTSDLEYLLFTNREQYLEDLSYVLLNLETHDEGRLLQSETGFDIWRGATFYAIAASSRGALMLQAGQEWGEPWDLGFRRSDYLRGRFPEEPNWNPQGSQLTRVYRDIHRARLAPENVALRHGRTTFPRTDTGGVNEQLFALVRYMEDCSSTVFGFHRLWVDDVETTYQVSDDLAGRICLADNQRYRLVDVFTETDLWQQTYPEGRTGEHIREFGIYVRLDLATPFQWLRLEML